MHESMKKPQKKQKRLEKDIRVGRGDRGFQATYSATQFIKRRHQQIDVYYYGVGIVYILKAEEMFKEHLEELKREREQEFNIKEKTA